MILEALVAAWAGFSVALPPKRYDYPHPNMRIRRAAPAVVHGLCKAMGTPSKGGRILACAQVGRSPCVVIMPSVGTYSAGLDARLLRHEQGHCNGWSAEHPK